MDPAYINLILSAFGPHLNILKIWRWTQIDLQALADCTALENLSFIDGCSFQIKDGDVATLTGFLPALEIFYSDSCLGPWSRFFETKSTLTSFRLNCCHVGTEVFIRLILNLCNNPKERLNFNRLISLDWNGTICQRFGSAWIGWY